MKESYGQQLTGADHVWHSGGINSLKGLSVTDLLPLLNPLLLGLAVGTRILGTGRG
jgi:hypothetical protein